jgi:hypothetical protein
MQLATAYYSAILVPAGKIDFNRLNAMPYTSHCDIYRNYRVHSIGVKSRAWLTDLVHEEMKIFKDAPKVS